jgi:hypothetical protein
LTFKALHQIVFSFVSVKRTSGIAIRNTGKAYIDSPVDGCHEHVIVCRQSAWLSNTRSNRPCVDSDAPRALAHDG